MNNELIQHHSKLGVTFVAIRYGHEAEENRKVRIGVSRCQAPDIFCKRKGLELARQHSLAGLSNPYEAPLGSISYEYQDYILALQRFRMRARKYFKGLQVLVSGAK